MNAYQTAVAAQNDATRKANESAVRALPMAVDRAGLKLRGEIRGELIVFTGGAMGEHSLDLLVTDAARAWAHWHGYCESNRVTVPRVAPPPPAPPKPARKPTPSGKVSAQYNHRKVKRDDDAQCANCGTSRSIGALMWFADHGNFCTRRCADDLRRDLNSAGEE